MADNRELRQRLEAGLTGHLVRMVKQAEGVAEHSCTDQADQWAAQQRCGACLIARISAEVYVPPRLGTT